MQQLRRIRQGISKYLDIAITAIGSFAGVLVAKFCGSNGNHSEEAAGLLGGVLAGGVSDAVRPALSLPILSDREEDRNGVQGLGLGYLAGKNMGGWVGRVSANEAAADVAINIRQ